MLSYNQSKMISNHNILALSHIYLVLYYHWKGHVLSLLIPFTLLRFTVKYKMADCKKGNRTNQDGIILTEIILEGRMRENLRTTSYMGSV